nr:substrate-binding domain-containing protein [uncultured Aminipila sp.]
MMFNKKSKDAIEDETSQKKGKVKKAKKPKPTPHEKAIKNKQKVERAASAKVRRADAKVKKAEQDIKNKEKAAAKKIKDREKKVENKIKAEEKKIEKEEKKKEQRVVNKLKKKDDKIKEKAERMQRKAELAARSPLQKKVDRRLKMKKFLSSVLILLILTGLVFAGIKFGPKLIEKFNLPEINFSQITDNIKSKIPFLNKEDSDKEDTAKDEQTSKEDTKTEAASAETTTAEAITDNKTLYISGTSVLKDFYTEALGEFLGLSKKELKEHSGVASTNDAYTNLINGDQQVIFSTFPTEKETKMAELAGVDLQPIPILNGGFVFFVNKDNPVKNLTTTQLYNIYSGTITNWKDLGGKNESIVAYQRTDNSGSQLGMHKYVINKNEIMKASDEMKVSDTKDIIKDIASNTGSIGYSYYYYLAKNKNSDDVKIIAVNGIQPDKKTIASAEYPLTTYTYAIVTTEENTKSLTDVISSVDDKVDAMRTSESVETEDSTNDSKTTDAAVKAEPQPLKLKFIKWILSDEGQKMAEQKGFIRHDNNK